MQHGCSGNLSIGKKHLDPLVCTPDIGCLEKLCCRIWQPFQWKHGKNAYFLNKKCVPVAVAVVIAVGIEIENVKIFFSYACTLPVSNKWFRKRFLTISLWKLIITIKYVTYTTAFISRLLIFIGMPLKTIGMNCFWIMWRKSSWKCVARSNIWKNTLVIPSKVWHFHITLKVSNRFQ